MHRHLILPDHGTLLVSTDLHGNGQDFRVLEAAFRESLARDPDTQWVLLGDVVHAPNPEAQAENPALYDFMDESAYIVRRIIDLRRELPGHVHYVLGNHDYAHVGGPVTSKFYDDEAATLEATLDPEELAAMRALFREGLLAVTAPCGIFFAHGSPNATLRDVADLDAVELPPQTNYHRDLVATFLTHYGQRPDVTSRLLATVSAWGVPVNMVIHGHDRDEMGWYTHGDNQGCAVLFGAPRRARRYLHLDLAAHYGSVHDLREGGEVRRLYPE